jgi:hypothetical protein
MKLDPQIQQKIQQVDSGNCQEPQLRNSDSAFKNLIDNLFIFMIGGAFIGNLIAQTPGLIVGLIISGVLAVSTQKPNTLHDYESN